MLRDRRQRGAWGAARRDNPLLDARAERGQLLDARAQKARKDYVRRGARWRHERTPSGSMPCRSLAIAWRPMAGKR